MDMDDKCPCKHVEQLRNDFEQYKRDNNKRVKLVEDEQTDLKVVLATINAKLSFIIGGIGVISVALAAVIVPMMFGR